MNNSSPEPNHRGERRPVDNRLLLLVFWWLPPILRFADRRPELVALLLLLATIGLGVAMFATMG